MMITANITAKSTIEVPEDAFPIYRLHDVTDDHRSIVIYSRTTRDTQGFITVSVRVTGGNGVEVERDHSMQLPYACEDYLLGKGEYACTEAEFNKACQQAQVLLSDIRGIPCMDEARAKLLLGSMVRPNKRLASTVPCIYWDPIEDPATIAVADKLTADQLEAMAWWMRAYTKSK